jgi:ABC-type uncharacterized transport system permease subunit
VKAVYTLLVTLTLLNVFALAAGAAPLDVYAQLFRTTFASSYGLAQVAFKATPLVFLGIAAALAFRAGQLNIGLEGQLIVGSFVMGITATAFSPTFPGWLGALLACLAAALAAAAFALIPALLKLKLQAPEVMSSIMLNFIAAFAANMAIKPFAVAESSHTQPVAEALRLTTFGAQGSQLSSAFLLAVLLAALMSWFLFRTRRGFELRAFGSNPKAAELYGVSPSRTVLLSFAASGALAGLAAMSYVLGQKGFHEDGFSGGIGFLALGVALLARNHPLAVIPAALLFGFLQYGSLAVNQLVPKEMMDVLTAAVMVTSLLVWAKRRR